MHIYDKAARYFLCASLMASMPAWSIMAQTVIAPSATSADTPALRPSSQPASPEATVAQWPATTPWGAAALALLLATCAGSLAFAARARRETRRLRVSETRLRTILDSVDACIYVKDAELRYTYGNRKLCDYFGRGLHEIVGVTDDAFLMPTALAEIRHADLQVIEQAQRVVCEEEVPRPDGSGVVLFLSIKIPLRAADGSVQALCGISTDITELRHTREAVQRLAYYDALTELPNRRLLQERMEGAMRRQKATGALAAVLFIDLDKFKNINDERGHEIGDAVLRCVARRLEDVVGGDGMVTRLGGDEFVILLHDLGRSEPDATSRALQVADAVREDLATAVVVNEQAYFTGGSIGVTLLDVNTKSVADVLREADTAMYQAKDRGRNLVALYEPTMHTHVSERAALLRDLVTAVGSGEFTLLVQPQCDASNRVVGAEVLLRWEHPQRGTLRPEKFIGLAEESGLILPIGEWALEEACHLHARLAAQGMTCPVSVNVSPVQLRHPQFDARLRDILRITGTPAEALILELTENVLIDDVDETAGRMQALAQLGFRFSIDDFGTGYSGLAYLHRLPLYELKIAETFVRNLPDDDAGSLIRLIIATARLLNLRVVAEGVEHRRQADFLASAGCDAQQGYYYQRPMPIDEWITRMAPSGAASATPGAGDSMGGVPDPA